jgi:hypothetical protein
MPSKRLKLTGLELHELRKRVFMRDHYRCVGLTLDETHVCTDAFGPLEPVGGWDYINALTLEHVSKFSGMGMRADDREEQCLTLCIGANALTGWASRWKHEERAHLAKLYPEHWSDVPEVSEP